MSVNTKLTNLANEIREISGTTTKKSLDVMASDISAANDLIDEQETLLNDLRDIVDTLPEPGVDTSDATANAHTIASGYTAYVKGSKVTGSVPQRTISDVTVSGSQVNIPAGFYMGGMVKSVGTGKATTPTTTITAKPTISIDSAGKITASTSASKSITPTITAGYISSGTAGTVTASGSNTKQLITKAATTYTPGTGNQTIAASTYLTGAQTIKGDINLVASNIKNGVSIFGVAGSYVGGIDGVVQESDYAGNEYISIYGNRMTSDIPEVRVYSYTGKVFTNNSTVDFTVGPYSTVNIIDGGINTITATNLSAENIKSGVDILGTVGTLEPATDGVEYHLDDEGLSIDRSFGYIDIKQENEIYTYADCVILPSGNLRLNEADGTTDLYVNTIFNNIVISSDNAVEIRNINCDLNFDGVNSVVVNAEDGMDTDFEINSSFNNIYFNADNRIMFRDSELTIASDRSGTLQLKDFSGTANAPTLVAENIKSGVNILGVTGNYTGITKSSGSYHIDVTDGYHEYIIPDSAHFIIDCSEYYTRDLDGVAIRINGSTKLCFGNDRGSSGMNIGLDDYEYVHVFIKGSYVTFVSEEGSCYIHDEQTLIQGFEIATIANEDSISIYVTHEI